jgi:hypothetical protein
MTNLAHPVPIALALAATARPATADPTVYIPLGSADQVIEVDAAMAEITATVTGVENPHGLVATPTVSTWWLAV